MTALSKVMAHKFTNGMQFKTHPGPLQQLGVSRQLPDALSETAVSL